MAYVEKKELYKLFEESNGIIKLHVSDVDMLSTVDVVEVVRCFECVNGKKAVINDKGFKICPASGMEIADNDYCSYGERKTT